MTTAEQKQQIYNRTTTSINNLTQFCFVFSLTRPNINNYVTYIDQRQTVVEYAENVAQGHIVVNDISTGESNSPPHNEDTCPEDPDVDSEKVSRPGAYNEF